MSVVPDRNFVLFCEITHTCIICSCALCSDLSSFIEQAEHIRLAWFNWVSSIALRSVAIVACYFKFLELYLRIAIAHDKKKKICDLRMCIDS